MKIKFLCVFLQDWHTCTKHFQIVLENEFTRTQRERKSNIGVQYMHFCWWVYERIKFMIWQWKDSLFNLNSARYSYENCVGNSARAKCKPESARFTRSLVELLSSERQFQNCAKIEDSLCSSAKRGRNFFNLLFAGFTLGMFFNKRFDSVLL